MSRRLRWAYGCLYGGLAVVVTGFLIDPPVNGNFPAVLLVGVAVAAVASLTAHFYLLRCPWCRGNVAEQLMSRGWMTIDPRLGYCPFCGTNLDNEIPEPVGVETDDRGPGD